MTIIDNPAEPFFFTGSATSILLIHGFMGLPGELRPLGQFLAERGYTIAGPLLARHGQHPDALYRVRWPEWYDSVVAAYRALQAQDKRVIVAGYSLGGLLALHLAAHEPIAGIVTLAAALNLAGGWPLRTLPVTRYVMPWFYPMRRANFNDPLLRTDLAQKMGQVDFDDPAVVAQLRATIRIPTGAIHEIVRLARIVQRDLPRVTAPALVLQGRQDQTVLPGSADAIMQRIGSRDKQMRWFERSGHLLPNDVEHEAVWQSIAEWLALHDFAATSATQAPATILK